MSLKPKKSLGQNFLVDKNIINKIIHTAKIRSSDVILEVGPGTGNLTKFIIAQKPKKIYLIEKDENLAHELEKQYLDIIKLWDIKSKNRSFIIKKYFGDININAGKNGANFINNLIKNKKYEK